MHQPQISHTHSDPALAPHAEPTSPPVIRCETTADFLAALPRLVGFTAPDSLFIVLFSGSRAHGAMRVDLPDDETPTTLDAYIAELIGWVSHAQQRHGTSRPAIVVSSALSFADAGEIPWRRLAGRLDAGLERAGISPRELCCLAPDGWASYLDLAAPPDGYPLSIIDASAAAPTSSPPTLADLGRLRRVPRSERAAFARALTRERSKRAHPSFGSFSAAHEPQPASDRRERHLRERLGPLFAPGHRTPEECASLVTDLCTDDGWACAFGELTAAAFAAHHADMSRADESRVDDTSRAGDMSRADDAARAPTRAALGRVVAASDTLAFIAPLVPRDDRAAIVALCALAWWLRGLESVAAQHIAAARRLDAGHRVVGLADEVIRSGSFPLTTRRST